MFDVVFTNLHGGHLIMLGSSTLLRQMGCQYDNITDNIFMLHYLLSPCNFYLLDLINAPDFNSIQLFFFFFEDFPKELLTLH